MANKNKYILILLRLFDKIILAESKEKFNTYRWFNKKFNKEVIYNYREL